MAKFSKLIGRNMLADEVISLAELDLTLQAQITQITTNKNAIQAINDSKGAANGIATLGADGRLLSSQIPSIAVSDYLGEVATTTAMYALAGQRGDWATVVPADNAANAQSYMRVGEGNTAADWKAISTPLDGVTALRNVSGTISGQNGVVTLANVAFSGAANDVAFADASYGAGNVSGALVEVMAKANDAAGAVATLQTAMGSKIDIAGITPYVELTGTIDGSNKTFTCPIDLAGAKVLPFIGSAIVTPSDFSVSGNNVVFTVSPDHEYERPGLMVFKAA